MNHLLIFPATDPLDWAYGLLQYAIWFILQAIGIGLWKLDQGILAGAIFIHGLRHFLSDPNGLISLVITRAFGSGTGGQAVKSLFGDALRLAMIMLAITLALRALLAGAIQLVDPRKLVVWAMLAFGLFSSSGAPVVEVEASRLGLAQSAAAFSADIAAGLADNGNLTGGNVPANGLAAMPPHLLTTVTHLYTDAGEYTPLDPVAYWIGGATTIPHMDDSDINGSSPDLLPMGLKASYFLWPDGGTKEARDTAIQNAIAGIIHLAGASFGCLFVAESALIWAALAFAVLILALGLPIALPFSLFTGTEGLLLGVGKTFIGILIRTWIAAVVEGMFTYLLIYWSRTGNGIGFVGTAAAAILFNLPILWMAVSTITGSFDMLSTSLGGGRGGQIERATGAALAAATGGASVAAGMAEYAIGGSRYDQGGRRPVVGIDATPRPPRNTARGGSQGSDRQGDGGPGRRARGSRGPGPRPAADAGRVSPDGKIAFMYPETDASRHPTSPLKGRSRRAGATAEAEPSDLAAPPHPADLAGGHGYAPAGTEELRALPPAIQDAVGAARSWISDNNLGSIQSAPENGGPALDDADLALEAALASWEPRQTDGAESAPVAAPAPRPADLEEPPDLAAAPHPADLETAPPVDDLAGLQMGTQWRAEAEQALEAEERRREATQESREVATALAGAASPALESPAAPVVADAPAPAEAPIAAATPAPAAPPPVPATPRQPSATPGQSAPASTPRPVAFYDYGEGANRYQVVRMEPKDFRQRHPRPGVTHPRNDVESDWVYTRGDAPWVLYRQDAIAAAPLQTPIFAVEGEKDANRLQAEADRAGVSLIATTNAGGGDKWRPEYSEALRGRPVVIVPDADAVGARHTAKVGSALTGVAGSVQVANLPDLPAGGKDLSDWFDAGHSVDELMDVVNAAPAYAPPAPPPAPAAPPRQGRRAPEMAQPSPELSDYLVHKYTGIARSNAGTPEGRSKTGSDLAHQLRDARYSYHDAQSVMRDYQQAVTSGATPYTAKEAEATLRTAYRSAPRAPMIEPTEVRQARLQREGVQLAPPRPANTNGQRRHATTNKPRKDGKR